MQSNRSTTSKNQQASLQPTSEPADVCVIGHVTKDRVITPDLDQIMPGGTAYYCSMALCRLGARVCLVTKLSAKDQTLLAKLRTTNLQIICKDSPTTTSFENIYPDNIEHRQQRVIDIAAPITLRDVKSAKASIYHLGTLTATDICVDVIEHLSQRGMLAMDIQGVLRTVHNFQVRPQDWRHKNRILPWIDILKADEAEAQTISGQPNIERAAQQLGSYGIGEIIVTRSRRGSLIYANQQFYHIPNCPVLQPVDSTGCGDTFMAGYLYKRSKGADFLTAGKFAAATAALKMERAGPFDGTSQDVNKRLQMLENSTKS